MMVFSGLFCDDDDDDDDVGVSITFTFCRKDVPWTCFFLGRGRPVSKEPSVPLFDGEPVDIGCCSLADYHIYI